MNEFPFSATLCGATLYIAGAQIYEMDEAWISAVGLQILKGIQHGEGLWGAGTSRELCHHCDREQGQ